MRFQVGEIVKFRGVNMYIDEVKDDGKYILSDGYDRFTVSEDTVIDGTYLTPQRSKRRFRLNLF